MKEMIKWGFIGCGDVAEKKSGPAFNKVEGSMVEAVMCRSKERTQSYAERHNINKWYTDAHELINDPEVNAIYVATPPSSHATYAIMAMKAGKPVYIEKPMAASYADCIRINRVSEEQQVPCFVAYYRRYLPYFKKVKELLQSGAIGHVLDVQIRLVQPPYAHDYDKENPAWRIQPDLAGGGYFYDLAAHQIDILQDYFGLILSAEGMTANHANLYDAEDTVSACFGFESGLTASGSWCFVAAEQAKEDRIKIVGDKGTISFSSFTFEPILLCTDKGQEEYCPANPENIQYYLIKSVVEHLQGKGVCECDGISATTTNWVMDKILGKS